MPAETLKLEVVTPDRLVLTESVDEVILPSVEGYFGVRPGHTPLLARLDAGEISYRRNGEDKFLAVSGGFVEVLRGGVQVLAVTCEAAEEIDVERARSAKERAEARLKKIDSDLQVRRAEVSMKKAISRIQVSSHLR